MSIVNENARIRSPVYNAKSGNCPLCVEASTEHHLAPADAIPRDPRRDAVSLPLLWRTLQVRGVLLSVRVPQESGIGPKPRFLLNRCVHCGRGPNIRHPARDTRVGHRQAQPPCTSARSKEEGPPERRAFLFLATVPTLWRRNRLSKDFRKYTTLFDGTHINEKTTGAYDSPTAMIFRSMKWSGF